jgi:hypothetical protein
VPPGQGYGSPLGVVIDEAHRRNYIGQGPQLNSLSCGSLKLHLVSHRIPFGHGTL